MDHAKVELTNDKMTKSNSVSEQNKIKQTTGKSYLTSRNFVHQCYTREDMMDK